MNCAASLFRGTKSYRDNAAELIERYESLPFAHKHEAVLHLIPTRPSKIVDIGAGTGADAAWFASQGHQVVAVEPTDAFRDFGLAHHVSPLIEWVNDGLPRLERLTERKRGFSLVMLTAVWMHLDAGERSMAMPVVASLLAPNGVLIMTLRHGPAPIGRAMFAVTAKETVALAEAEGLRCMLNVRTESIQPVNRSAGVTWSRLAFGHHRHEN
jgi:SAM-dependent methyltransferase